MTVQREPEKGRSFAQLELSPCRHPTAPAGAPDAADKRAATTHGRACVGCSGFAAAVIVNVI
jgi:hypothetical protein